MGIANIVVSNRLLALCVIQLKNVSDAGKRFERDTPAIGSQDRSPVEARAAIRSLKTLHTKACVSWTHSYSTDGE